MKNDFIVPETSLNPELLIWARVNQGMTRREAAHKLQVPEPELMEYELGTRSPMWSFIEKCADLYKRPRAVFLLESPPVQDRRQLVAIKALYSDGTEQEYKFEKE